MKPIMFEQCDSPDEVRKLFDKVFANQEIQDAKLGQLSADIEEMKKPKKKKKGSVRVRLLAFLAILCVSAACYGVYVTTDINYEIASNPETLSQYLRDSFANVTSETFTYTPRDSEPPTAEGKVYYDDGTKKLNLYNGTIWQPIDVAGGVSLDGAYDFGGAGAGRTINATDGAVNFQNTTADAASVLTVSHTGVADGDGITVTVSGSSQDGIEIENTGTGYDIEGTGALWYAPKTGVVFATGLIVNTSDITFQEQGEKIINDTDNEVEFFGSEDFSIGLGSGGGNQIDFTSDSAAVTIDFTTLDALIGLNSLTFDETDGAATITIAADGTDDDITLSQTGSQDASVVITSAGTGDDAIDLNASAGGITLDAVAPIDIEVAADGAADDIIINQSGTQNASILLTSAGTGSDAISLVTSAATGDIVINSGDVLDIDAADDITIDLAGAAGEDILLTNTGGSIVLSATEDATDAINIDATAGGIDIDAAGEAGDDIVLTNTGGSVLLSASEDATDAIDIDATAGGIDIDATGEAGQDIIVTNTGGSVRLVSTESAVDSIVLQSTLGGIDILCDASTNEDIDIINTGGAVNLKSTEATDLAIHIETTNAAGQIQITSTDTTIDGIEIDSSGGLDVDAADVIALDNSGAGKDITLTSALGSVVITGTESAAAAVSLIADGVAGGVNIDAKTGGIDMDAVGGIIALDVSGAGVDITLDSDAGAVSIDGGQTGAAAVVIIASHTNGGIDIDSGTGGIAADSTGIVSIGGADDMDFTLTSGSDAEDLTIAVGGSGNSSLLMTSIGTATDAMSMQVTGASGGIDIDTTNDGVINITSTDDLVLEVTAGSTDEDIIIQTTGATDNHILLDSEGTSANTIALQALAGGLDIDAKDDIVITCASSAGDDDLQLVQTGAFNASITLTAAGTGTDAILLNATAGGVDINAKDDFSIVLTTTAQDDDLIISTTGSDDTHITITADGTSVDALGLQASGGGIDMDAVDDINILLTASGANEDIIIATGGTQDSHITINSDGSSANALTLNASVGGLDMDSAVAMDIDAAGVFTLNQAGDTLTIQLDSDGAGDDLSLIVDGDDDASIVLNCDGTAANAIDIDVAAGGIDIDMAGSDAGEDFQITTATSIDFISTEANAGQFKMDAQGTIGGFAIILQTTNGGIQIHANDGTNGDITIDAADVLSLISAGDLTLDITGTGTFKGQFFEDSRVTITKSANYTTVNPTDIGKLILVDTAAVVITMPAVTQAGETYTIMNIAADGTEIFVDVDGADQILGGCGIALLDAGDKLTNTGATADKGDYVTLTYSSGDGWYVTAMNGTWVDGG